MKGLAMVVGIALAACSVAEPAGPAPDRDAWHPADVPSDPAVAAEDIAGGPDDAAVEAEAEAAGGEDVSGPDAEGGGPDGDAFTYPDPAFVHVRTGQAVVRAGDPYLVDEPTQYRTADQLPDLDVRAMSAAGGSVWTGTARGLYRYDPGTDRFTRIPLGEGADQAAVLDLSRGLTGDGRLVALQEGSIYLVHPGDATIQSFSTGLLVFSAVEAGDDEVWASTSGGGLWRIALPSGATEPLLEASTGAVRDLAVDSDGVVWMASDSGLKTWDGQAMGSRTAADGTLLDDDVRAVVALSGGRVAAATSKGLSILTPQGPTLVPAGVGGLPMDDLRAVSCDEWRCLVGHRIGASLVAVEPGFPPVVTDVHHYVSLRWLPSDDVRAVAMDAGRLWIGTAAGVSRIAWKTRTFAEKAEAMESLQEAHFWRLDFVPSDVGTDDPWNPTQWWTWDKDNDGLWTQMQIGRTGRPAPPTTG